MSFRSLLFVPGARPERFEKAATSGADCVCIDLEDAVALADKTTARGNVVSYFEGPIPETAIGVRINALDDPLSRDDIASLAALKTPPAFVMIPKLEKAEQIHQVRAALGDVCPIWSLVETPQGLLNAPDIAEAIGEQGGLIFGGVDYAAAIGADRTWDAFLYARGCLVNAAAIGGCQLLDVPFLDVKDSKGLEAETRRVKMIGFTGKACIHPAQTEIVNKVFSPTPEEVVEAKRIINVFQAAKGGVALLDGKLIEKPVIKSAQRILRLDGE